MDLNRVTDLLSAKQIRSIAEATARICLWDGAIRSGKTVASLLRWLIYVSQAPPGELVVVAKTTQTAARNVFAPLQDFTLFGELATQTAYTPGAPSGIILGRRVWVIGANDTRSEGRLRGLTCAGAYVDEASLVPQQFFTQLLGRMSVPGAQMFATTNPDNPAHWLRTDFLARAGQLNLRNWHFALTDNPSLTPDYVAAISAEFTGLWYRRFILGEWVAAEGAIYDMWDPDRHVVDLMPPIVSWTGVGVDVGTTNPFAALLLGTGADSRLYLVAEWRYDSRQAHRQLTDGEYSERLRSWLNQVPVPASRRPDGTWLRGVTPRHVCVDPSAASFRTQLHRDGLPSILADNSVLDGIRLMSTLLGRDLLKVHRSCEGFLAEVGGYSWDDAAAAKGEDKPVKIDDHCLAAGTLISTACGDVPIEHVQPGDQVMTRAGWRKVTAAWQVSPAAGTLTLETSDGARLTGTPNHLVYTGNRGWVRLDAVRYADKLVTWPKPSSTRDSATAATPIPPSGLSASTTFPVSPTGRNTTSGGSTRRSGKSITGRSLRAATSTTTTTTRSTTTRPTSSASTVTSTRATMRGLWTTPLRSSLSIWRGSVLSPWRGTGPMRDVSGTASTARRPWRRVNSSHTPASSAAPATKPSPGGTPPGSARTGASRRGGAQPASMTCSASVNAAGQSSPSTATPGPGTAGVFVVAVHGGSRQPVYDLTVDGAHEFFANGVLVHNSVDAARYVVATTRGEWGTQVQLAA